MIELKTPTEIEAMRPAGRLVRDVLAALTEAGAVAVRLGPSVLRTSTAATVALGALGPLTARWR